MAKVQKKYSFAKATITIENGKYIITEYGKEEACDYNLSDILSEFLDKDGVVMSIGVETEPTSFDAD